uniref:Uncharacterized protein n=1 Tax=Triticum urartu TaxID=4572 RepID=A0A8R7R1F5_TRIUA
PPSVSPTWPEDRPSRRSIPAPPRGRRPTSCASPPVAARHPKDQGRPRQSPSVAAPDPGRPPPRPRQPDLFPTGSHLRRCPTRLLQGAMTPCLRGASPDAIDARATLPI